MFNEIEKLLFSQKYASDNKEIKKILYSFDENKFIIKNNTGVGVTHAMCNYTGGNLIIISPNNSMIKGKSEGVYDCDKFISICGKNQQYKWDSVFKYVSENSKQNCVINCNPEQLLLAKSNPKLYPRLRAFNMFIDESHSYYLDSNYREDMGRVMELIYNDFSGGITLSTATPNPFNIDIPKEKEFKSYYIERVNDEPKQLQYSENIKNARPFILDEISKGNKVCVFTNSKTIHTSTPSNDVAINYLNLVGDNLRIKIQPHRKINTTDGSDLFKNSDVIFLSSAYFAGYDIPIDCSILIISEQNSPHTKININNVVQAYGRCRKVVKNALFINSLANYDTKGNKISYPSSKDEVRKLIDMYNYDVKSINEKIEIFGAANVKNTTKEGYVNRGVICSDYLNQIHDYFLYNREVRDELFKKYNFLLTEYKDITTNEKKTKSPTFSTKLNNLFSIEVQQLRWDYFKIRDEVKYKKDVGSFNYKLGLEYLSVYLIKKYEIEQLINNKETKPIRFYTILNNWMLVNCPLDYLNYSLSTKQLEQAESLYKEPIRPEIDERIVREWYLFYSMYCVGVGSYDEGIKKHLDIREIAGNKDIIIEANKNKNNRNLKAFRAVVSKLNKKYDVVSEDEKESINWVIKKSFKLLDSKDKNGKPMKYINFEKRKTNEDKIINLIIQLLNHGLGNYSNKTTDNREYGAITEVSKLLRKLLPLKYVELDITSANPQFIDYLYGSNNAFKVYENIMRVKNISREKAKTLFSTYLNSEMFTKKKAYTFYLDVCGYTAKQAKQLSELTANGIKGCFFSKMIEVEENLMSSVKNYLPTNCIRLHDALIIPAWEAEKISLPILFNGFRFHVGYFNNDEVYDGNVIELNKKQFMYSDFENDNKIDRKPVLNKEILTEYLKKIG